MRLAPLFALVSLIALSLTGCDEIAGVSGVGDHKGVYAGAADAPLTEDARRALGKRAQRQNFGL